MIDIKDIDKAALLAALFNHSKPQGLGFLAPKHNIAMTPKDAQKYIDGGQSYFDYLQGRVMKINISGDELNPTLYDRDNGYGAAQKVIDALREEQALTPSPQMK